MIHIKIPTEKQLEILVNEEEKIRMSKDYQDKCTDVKDVPNGWLDVTEQMQKDLVKKHGFTDDISCDVACNRLRRAQFLYPDNNIFKTVPVYVRENKANAGKYKDGDEVPNVNLFDSCGKEVKFYDLLNNDKINIVVAASLTWAPFKANLAVMNDLHLARQDINIFIVYITEAHAADVWPIGESAGEIIYTHKNINERLACVHKLKQKYNLNIPIYADNMENTFETEFSGWPTRYFVIKNNKFLKISYPTDAELDIVELFEFLSSQ